jgi:hypothetical protein
MFAEVFMELCQVSGIYVISATGMMDFSAIGM